MNDVQFPISDFFDILLWFQKEDYLTTNECMALVYLGNIANQQGYGYVQFAQMSSRFGQAAQCCRQHFHRPERHGLIEQWRLDARGGAAFKLLVPPSDTDNAAGQQVSPVLVIDQQPANVMLAPQCSAVCDEHRS